MTTTTNTKSNNAPAFELFTIEEKPADRAAAAKQGKVLAENATQRIWTKVGVAFVTKTGQLSLLIGERGDPAQKRYLMCATSALDKDDQDTRLPVAELFELNDGPIDFKRKAGVAWINRDESYNIVLGDRGDLHQPRFNMRASQPKRAPSTKPAPKTPQAAAA